MRVQAEDRAAAQFRRSLLHGADVEVAVLDRPRELALLERCPHRGILARRHTAPEHQRLGAAADAGPHGAHHDVIPSRLGQRNPPDLAAARLAQPERLRVMLRGPHLVVPPAAARSATAISSWTSRQLTAPGPSPATGREAQAWRTRSPPVARRHAESRTRFTLRRAGVLGSSAPSRVCAGERRRRRRAARPVARLLNAHPERGDGQCLRLLRSLPRMRPAERHSAGRAREWGSPGMTAEVASCGEGNAGAAPPPANHATRGGRHPSIEGRTPPACSD